MSVEIKNFEESQIDWLVKLNNDCVPAVDPHQNESMMKIINQSEAAYVAMKDGEPLGCVILLVEGKDYASRNYAWHSEYHDKHLYVDRIIISEAARGLGVGRKLYDKAYALAKSLDRPLTAEVNTVPDNPQSHAFHESLGFKTLKENHHHEDNYAVRYYHKID